MKLGRVARQILLLLEKDFEKHKLYDVHNNTKDAKEIEGELSRMLNISYASIGGFAGGGDLGEFSGFFVADVDEDPEVDLGLYYKNNHGLKVAALATDGGAEAKKEVVDYLVKMLDKPGTWIEVSDALANVLLKKKGLRSLDNEQVVKAALGGKKIEWHGKHPEGIPYGSGWYTRSIGGHDHTKVVVGRPR